MDELMIWWIQKKTKTKEQLTGLPTTPGGPTSPLCPLSPCEKSGDVIKIGFKFAALL